MGFYEENVHPVLLGYASAHIPPSFVVKADRKNRTRPHPFRRLAETDSELKQQFFLGFFRLAQHGMKFAYADILEPSGWTLFLI